MQVRTTEPAIRFHGGDLSDGTLAGRIRKKDDCRSGFRMETQHCPDSPDEPTFPNTILQPRNVLESQLNTAPATTEPTRPVASQFTDGVRFQRALSILAQGA